MNARVVFGALALVFGGSLGCGDSGTTSTTTTSTGGDETCTPGMGCPTVKTDCVGLVDNTGQKQFAVRISHLAISKPAVLAGAVVKTLLDDGVEPNLLQCQSTEGNNMFPGGAATGAFSWILQFDTTTNMLTTGGAFPQDNPNDGYCFVNKTIQNFAIKPLQVMAPIGSDGSFEIKMPEDVVVPVYSDRTAMDVILLPLKQVRIFNAKLSNNNNCIGTYNGAAMGDNFCVPSSDAPQYIDAASLEGFATLEDADAVTVPQLKKSLCLLLTNNDPMYADATNTKCKRDANNKILFPGDWCSTTNAAADGTCKDAMKLSATFAASSVAMKTTCP